MGNENSYAVNFAINTSVNPVCTAFTKDYTVIASHAIIVFKTLKKLGLLTPGGGGGGGPPASDLGRGAPTNYVIWHIHISEQYLTRGGTRFSCGRGGGGCRWGSKT